MDFTILYRVFWKPSAVFKQFKDETRLEPFIFVVLYVVGSYLWYKKDLISQPVLFLVNLLDGFSVALLFPVLNATLSFLIIRYWLKNRIHYISLVSVFILCGLPYFIEGILIAAFGYHSSTGLSSTIPIFGIRQPFLIGAIVMITPFFVWAVFLWWVALNQLINFQRWQSRLIISSLVLMNLVISGAWRQIKYMMAK